MVEKASLFASTPESNSPLLPVEGSPDVTV